MNPQTPARTGVRMILGRTLAASALLLLTSTMAHANGWEVTNCDDSGAGSLRYAVEHAASGDIVAWSQNLPANCTINLWTPIVVSVDNLTIKGRTTTITLPGGGQSTIYVGSISGQNMTLPFLHSGTNGTLTLDTLSIRLGKNHAIATDGNGGCVSTSGSLVVKNSQIYRCETSTQMAAAEAAGGLIYAGKNVTVKDSLLWEGTALSHDGPAAGGAIWAGNGMLRIEGSTISNSLAKADGNGNSGAGGVLARELEVFDSTIRGNRAEALTGSAVGGGMVTLPTALGEPSGAYLSNTRVLNNQTSSNSSLAGGAYFALGQATLVSSTFSENTAGNAAGGIFAVQTELAIIDSAIVSNSAPLAAGLVVETTAALPGPLVSQSTISGNVSSESGYGAGLVLTTAGARIENSTITENREEGLDEEACGAGICLARDMDLELSSSIVSSNRGARGGTVKSWNIGMADGAASVSVSGSHNLVGSSHGGISMPAGLPLTDLVKLLPLADNGGPTPTHLPQADSPVVDNGLDNGNTHDQRGVGFARVVGLAADIGAAELGSDTIFADSFEGN